VNPRGSSGGAPLDTLDTLTRWLEWQYEHTQALEALQQAERAYHRSMADAAFAIARDSNAVDGSKASLEQVDAARKALDDVRGRRPNVYGVANGAKPPAHNSGFCRPTVRTSTRSKWRLPNSKPSSVRLAPAHSMMCAIWSRRHWASFCPTNARTTSGTPDTASPKRCENRSSRLLLRLKEAHHETAHVIDYRGHPVPERRRRNRSRSARRREPHAGLQMCRAAR